MLVATCRLDANDERTNCVIHVDSGLNGAFVRRHFADTVSSSWNGEPLIKAKNNGENLNGN